MKAGWRGRFQPRRLAACAGAVWTLWLAGCADPDPSAEYCRQLLATPLPPGLASAPGPDDETTAWIDFLAHPALAGRRAGSDGGRLAAAALLRHLTALGPDDGDEPDGDDLCRAFPLLGGWESNLVAVLPPSAQPAAGESRVRLLLGAHYDGQGLHPTGGPLPGADDNASGVAAVLELARRLRARPQARATVMLALFAAEEIGRVGSRQLAASLGDGRLDAAVILDMVGRPLPAAAGAEGRAALAMRTSEPRLAEDLRAAAARAGVALVAMDRLGRRMPGASDDLPLAESGVPAALISSGLHDDHHELGDTPERVDRQQVLRAADAVEAWVRSFDSAPRLAATAHRG